MCPFQDQVSSAATFEALEQVAVSTSDLADLFGVSTRQIELLANGGVLENIGSTRAMRFRFVDAVRHYTVYLMSGASLRDWAPK